MPYYVLFGKQNQECFQIVLCRIFVHSRTSTWSVEHVLHNCMYIQNKHLDRRSSSYDMYCTYNVLLYLDRAEPGQVLGQQNQFLMCCVHTRTVKDCTVQDITVHFKKRRQIQFLMRTTVHNCAFQDKHWDNRTSS